MKKVNFNKIGEEIFGSVLAYTILWLCLDILIFLGIGYYLFDNHFSSMNAMIIAASVMTILMVPLLFFSLWITSSIEWYFINRETHRKTMKKEAEKIGLILR